MLYLSPRQDALVRTTAYHAEGDGRETYAGYAIAKGPITQVSTWWLGIEQQFSPFLLKRVPREGFLRLDAGANFSSHG